MARMTVGSRAGRPLRKAAVVLAAVLCAAILSASASAVPPVLQSVAWKNGKMYATYSAPRSWLGGWYIARSPALDATGVFPQANMVVFDPAIEDTTTGSWSGPEPFLTPGTYWVILGVMAANDCINPDDLSKDPSCADGYSNELQLVVPRPTIHYQASVVFIGGEAVPSLEAEPIYENVAYQVCWKPRKGKKTCRARTIRYDEGTVDPSGLDRVEVPLRPLGKFTTFTWTVGGKVVATKRVRTHRK